MFAVPVPKEALELVFVTLPRDAEIASSIDRRMHEVRGDAVYGFHIRGVE